MHVCEHFKLYINLTNTILSTVLRVHISIGQVPLHTVWAKLSGDSGDTVLCMCYYIITSASSSLISHPHHHLTPYQHHHGQLSS